MSENNVPCIQMILDPEDFQQGITIDILPHANAPRQSMGLAELVYGRDGSIYHCIQLTHERVRILEDCIHEYYLHENDQDGPDLLAETEVLADCMTGLTIRNVSLVKDPLPHCGFNEPDLSTRVLPESADDPEHNRRRIEVFSSEIVTVTNEMLRDLDVLPDVRAWLAGGYGVPWDISRNEPEDV